MAEKEPLVQRGSSENPQKKKEGTHPVDTWLMERPFNAGLVVTQIPFREYDKNYELLLMFPRVGNGAASQNINYKFVTVGERDIFTPIALAEVSYNLDDHKLSHLSLKEIKNEDGEDKSNSISYEFGWEGMTIKPKVTELDARRIPTHENNYKNNKNGLAVAYEIYIPRKTGDEKEISAHLLIPSAFRDIIAKMRKAQSHSDATKLSKGITIEELGVVFSSKKPGTDQLIEEKAKNQNGTGVIFQPLANPTSEKFDWDEMASRVRIAVQEKIKNGLVE